MPEKKEAELGNSILAVLGGAAASVVGFFVLFPLGYLVLDWYLGHYLFEYPKNIPTIHQVIFIGTVVIWCSAAAFAGGLVCALISRAYEYRHVWILISAIGVFLLFQIFNNENTTEDEFLFSLLVLFISLSFLWGAKKGIRMKEKRLKQNTVQQ